ncbi:MAG: PSD1 and planctomycete cytochrome C domain-containing protein [Planctomycetales bacterium]
MIRRLTAIVGVCWGVCAGVSIGRAEETAAVDYQAQIKPLLTQFCVGCHGAQKQKSGLRLDTAKAALAGGDTGSAVVAGKSGESLLIQALTGTEGVAAMPPEGEPRPTAAEIALLVRWIDEGAKAPENEVAGAARDKRSDHWSFQPIVRSTMPSVKTAGWVRNPIDAFVLARQEQEGLQPAAEADRVTQIRRLSFDLLGLPPSLAEIDAFVADQHPQAYERLVERLLNSPHYGERWGRHWLDLARYADSNGFTRDFARSIWKYRDWVIDAVNRDLPFDQFTIEQLAGDMLEGATLQQRIATGFHRNTLINEEGGTDPEQFRVESVVDRVNTTGLVFLGLTVGCAQCHEHKYDPLSQREYYQLYAFLNNADEPKLDVPTAEQVQQGLVQKRDDVRRQVAELEQQFAARAAEFQAELDAWEKALTEDEKKKLPPEVLNAVNLAVVMRSDQNRKDLAEYYKKLEVARQKFPVLEQISTLRSAEPQFTTTMVLQERSQPRDTHIHIRGDFLRHGAAVTPAVPAVLPPLPESASRPTRLDLARWLVSQRNPLTPRVTVNRVWQKFFGRGIVETENDFGIQGTAPTHPELLDWLASEFMAPTVAPLGTTPGVPWSLKNLHALIVTSATYRQASRFRTELAEIDPANKLYARQSRLRIDAEVIRDAALTTSGLLNRTIGGPSVNPPQPDGVYDFTQDKKPWATATGPDRYRRGMYTYLWRSAPYPAMTVFDFPDANVTCTRRNRSNTPLQSLTLANDQQFVELAQGLALRVLKDAPTGDGPRLKYAFQTCLSRAPSDAESQRLDKLLKQQRAEFAAHPQDAEQLTPPLIPVAANVQEFAAWTAVARVLLNLDEFITRE